MAKLQVKAIKDNYGKKMIWPQFIYNIGWFFGNIKQTLSWLPIIWNDHQWDHYSIVDLLEKKLSLMRSFYSSDEPSAEGTDEVADQISEVLVVIKRIKEMEYSMNAINKFETKYPDYDWTIKTIPTDNPHAVEWVDDDTEEQSEYKTQCFDEADELEQKDFDLMFKLIRDNFENWWD